MPETPQDLSAFIARLAAANPGDREQAARELFRRGCASAEPVLAKWFADGEFRAFARPGNTLLTVGVAVEPARFQAIHLAAGQPRMADVPQDQDAMEFTLVFAHGVRLDILTPRDPAGSGPLARFLARFGEGVQQIECDVRDVSRATHILRTRFALEPVYPETRAGADGTRVNFFLAPLGKERKILIELVEVSTPDKNKDKRK
jgi:hypothetical protein